MIEGDNTVEQCTSIKDNMDDKQLIRVPPPRGEKTKRGRPPRGETAMRASQAKRQRLVEEEEGEDVCFICFDGGSLVLCDRKGCPKAYHPACIKRDEAFFRSKAKWNCGWHVCSVCQKASHYMCYTCTYSVCKGCTKNADFLCVRRNKGFCSTCMRIVMLIENIDQGIKEMVQVDFDDKSNWEYLFKVYWMFLKEKLSLTQSELIQAKNPWKGSDAVHAKQQRLPFGHPVAFDGKGIASKSLGHLELNKPKELLEPPCKDPPIAEIQTIAEAENIRSPGCTPQLEQAQPIELELQSKDSLKTEEASTATATSLNGCKAWASKELLEFVAHMKNGDTSALSHFEVQALLLKYIKRNKLRDPRQKSQIICDSRLKSLFGKHRAGHIEMLKLLEYHFLINEDSQRSAFIPAGIVGTVTNRAEADDNNDTSFLINKTKKRKSRKHSEESLVQINLDEYAAIDAHNINLIYLRRDLMESLIEDMEKFQGRVIGSVVRIRISGNNQKQDMYRLVHVVGTSKASVPYKIGDKTADVLLEVLNLNKKEVLPIDSISNQDFSEDECRRLRQIIKCGLVKRLTIGEIQKKAMELRAVKLNDSLEEEILRLNNLRDRASEKGRKKELRECVEKLVLLKMPEEHQRRLRAIPEVHADPKMDPNYETEEDAGESDEKKQAEYGGPKYTRFCRREDKLMSSRRKDKEGPIMVRCKVSEKREAHGYIMKKLGNQGTACQAVDRSSSETSITSFSTVNSTSTNNSETDKLWHYRDPSGRIQGPFSVTQLRKWNKSGLFPLDMRIWTNDEHHDSVLLTNALNGLFHTAPQVHGEISHQSQELGAVSVNSSIGWCESAAKTGRECGDREVPRHLRITNNHSNGNTETARMDGLSSCSPQCLNLNNSYSDKPNPSSPVSSSCHGNVRGAPPHEKRCHEIVDSQSSTGHGVQDSSGSTMFQISHGCNHSMQSHKKRHVGQSSGQNWRSSNSNRSSFNMNSGSSFASVAKSTDSFEQKGITSYPDLPSPTPKTSYDDIEAQAAEELLSLSSVVPVCASNIQDLPSPTPKLECEAPVGQAAAEKESLTSSFPVQDAGPSWSSASSLVIDGVQLPEIANGLGGYSPAAKPSLDSDLISDSAPKPAEAVGNHVDTPTSDANQLNHNSSCHPISNISDWRANFGEPIEFSTLDEESVSDLLAEVDAMESQTQSGMGSPTSAMRCSEETISVCKSDFFSFFEEFSPPPDPAKNDALGSTEDVQLPCQSSLTDELAGTSQAEAFDPLKRSSRTSSPSSEGETKSADVSFSQGEAGSNVPTPCTTNKTAVPVISQSAGLEAITTDCCAAPGNMTCGVPVQGFTNVIRGCSTVTALGRSNMNHSPFTGNPLSESQCIYSGERSGGPRDLVFQ
ncbi:zinc finger CCCH domain-containing protein 44-like [Lycium ferocissimum]|uniref:zinc finger CCCH domain-containing protein 44-like n=1 Tax=Lycium ferocissimum TaxID=112874 RepID=UPI002815013B|nr:zinc finger CCCH domain-containing protein 44-like [Lycium ferocissimum]